MMAYAASPSSICRLKKWLSPRIGADNGLDIHTGCSRAKNLLVRHVRSRVCYRVLDATARFDSNRPVFRHVLSHPGDSFRESRVGMDRSEAPVRNIGQWHV